MRLHRKSSRSSQAGFTFVEIAVIAPIVILTITAFITLIVNMTGEVLASRGASQLTYNVQDALNRIDDDVKLSSGFLAESNVQFSNPDTSNTSLDIPQGSDDSTNATKDFENVGGTNGPVLILNTLATTGNPLASTSSIAYLSNKPNACGALQNKNTPLALNIIYYVKNGSLWRRTMMPYNYVTTSCNVNGTGIAAPWQQPSCSPGYTSTNCKTQDLELVDGMDASGLNIQYYTDAAATSSDTVSTTSTNSPSVRNAALVGIANIGVTIDAKQTVAGRPVEQVASIRSTRLDTNASAFTTLTDAAPSVPVVQGTYAAPATATFTWSLSAGTGTITYNLDYSTDNGTTWTSGLTNSGATTYTVPNTTNSQTVTVRVKATNSLGTSGYGTGSVTTPLWVPATVQNGWVNYASGGFSTPAYTKTPTGLVVLKGLLTGGTATAGKVIMQLPVGYRPAGGASLMFQNSSNDAAGRVDIDTNGNVTFQVGANGYFSLDGINFMAAGAPLNVPFTNLTLVPSANWQYHNGGFDVPQYGVDTIGRVHLQGLMGTGTGTTNDGTTMATYPSTYAPSNYMHISNDQCNTGSLIGVDTAGGVQAKGNTCTSYLGIQAMFLPSSYSGWSSLSLQNGWNYLGTPYSPPQYTKTSDGMVMVRGLINSGTATYDTVIANLPQGYRPTERILYTIASCGGWGRVDVYPNGNITVGSVNNCWVSLDNLTFPWQQ